MKITHIKLTDFGSYAQAQVALEGISAAVITGPNGAGKSTAFVDAILWCLFGKCRTETDKMLRLGAEEMSVAVQFELTGQRYRVIRRRSLKTKAGKSDLELQVVRGGAVGEWTPMSGARMAETQEKICQLLNMDYDLLTSTGFLLQGQADRFSRATSTERKAILAQILRLDQYPRLRSACSAAWQGLDTRTASSREAHRVASDRAATLAGRLTESRQIVKEIEAAEATIESQGPLVETLRSQLAEGTVRRDAAVGLPEKIVAVDQRKRALREKQRILFERQNRAQKILENKDVIAAKVQEEESVRRMLSLMVGVEGDPAVLRVKQDEIRLHLEEGIALERREQDAINALAVKADQFKYETERLRGDLVVCEKSVRLLGSVPCGEDLQRICQFTLDAVKNKDLAEDLKAQLLAREQITYAPSVQTQALAEAIMARAEWEAQGWDAQAIEIQTEITEVETRMAADREQRTALEERLSSLDSFTRLVPELDAATRELQQVESDLATVILDVSALDRDLLDMERQRQESSAIDVALASVTRQLSQSLAVLVSCQASLVVLALSRGQVEEQCRQAEQAQSEAAILAPRIQAAEQDLAQFQQLMAAYDKIPVLILESAIPLVEQEANTILGRISPSGMKVRLDTQRTLKSRDGLAETLEIVVRDVYGERPYENYSGGEKFRLDLALRIGLSKLLSNRAGARLETLVIDEGLGSLDEDGLAQLRECLAALQAEFPLILVVTHVEAMKHTFPSQLVVSKGEHGSEIEVAS